MCVSHYLIDNFSPWYTCWLEWTSLAPQAAEETLAIFSREKNPRVQTLKKGTQQRTLLMALCSISPLCQMKLPDSSLLSSWGAGRGPGGIKRHTHTHKSKLEAIV